VIVRVPLLVKYSGAENCAGKPARTGRSDPIFSPHWRGDFVNCRQGDLKIEGRDPRRSPKEKADSKNAAFSEILTPLK